ncbi:MBL fold metallo-hydrolase [Patescibacteria group bacterium]|nr:MBL fold metallo-hydrolase [Patescibacteria group bacterium]MBU1256196.1 MBL fold metallo-hydrolase [Patescibacteria group bacterium]MBU1457787.1 MBL fold metallo-hydrolase [Patescibacteria group bacterium]
MEIKTLSLGPLQTNCYLVWCPKTQEAIIIDPADEADFITQEIIDLKLKPKYIVLTHGHFDHVLGVLELKLNFNIPILLHKADLPLYKQTQKSAQYWLQRQVDPTPPPDKFIKQNDQIKFGKESLKVIETPGHTPGSICLLSPVHLGGAHLFSGDTLFKNGIGRTDFSYSSSKDMQNSLQKLAKLPPTTKVYPGHGEPTTIAQESLS